MGARPFEAYRGGRLEALDRAFAGYLARGFPTAAFDGQPEPETLQCRDELDRTNWLGLLLKAQAMIAAGQGDALCEPPIRCTSNRMYAVSWSEVQARLFALMDLVGSAQANLWRLKDQIAAAPSREALLDIDLTEGWP